MVSWRFSTYLIMYQKSKIKIYNLLRQIKKSWCWKILLVMHHLIELQKSSMWRTKICIKNNDMLNITPPEGPTDCIELFLEKCLPLYFKKFLKINVINTLDNLPFKAYYRNARGFQKMYIICLAQFITKKKVSHQAVLQVYFREFFCLENFIELA